MTSSQAEGLFERSRRYWYQALEHLRNREAEKAGELFWGSIAEAIKAIVMLKMGLELRSHGQIHSYMRQTANILHDKELYELYREAEELHVNFYEGHLDIDDLAMKIPSLEKLMRKIEALAV